MFKSLSFKKWTSIVIAFLLMFSIVIPGQATMAKAAETSKVFDIIEITDFHGSLEDASSRPVAAVLAKNVKDVKDANPTRTLIIGGGDLYQGSPLSNTLRGVPVQKVMSNIGMEVTALGNHEFDWKLDEIINKTMVDAKYSIVCANLYKKSTGTRVFEPYKIIEKDGIKIGIIGAVTPATVDKALAANVAEYEFKDIASEINSVVEEVRSKGANVVIALMHEGDNLDNKTGPIFDIANKLKGVDAIFGGDSHSTVNAVVNGIPVYVANNAGRGYIHAKMTIGNDGKVSFTGEYIDLYTDKPNGWKAANPVKDPEAEAIVSAAKDEVGPTFNKIIGSTPSNLDRTQAGKPYGESYLGNWIADVVKTYGKADVGMQNNGGIRVDVSKGDITVGTINYIMPFDNEICTLRMTKAQLKTVLEQAFMDGGKGVQISGIKVKYNSAKPSMNRVIDITREDGTPVTDADVLTVATNDFMATGGDGFKGFLVNGKDVSTRTSIIIRDAMIDNVKANKGIVTVMNGRIENLAKGTVSVVATTDLHGNIYAWDYFANKSVDQGLAKVSTYVKNLRASNANVMLVDNGDTIQGTPLVTYYNMVDTYKSYPMMEIMGAIGYDTWTLGNHEFNYGLGTLNRIINDAKTNGVHVLGANVYNEEGYNYVDPYYIKDFNVNGKVVKVAVIGLTNQNIPGWEDPAHYAGLHFNDPVEQAMYWVPKVRAKGANVVIVTAHTGEANATSVIGENQIADIAKMVKGIDVIVAGHTHVDISSKIYKNPDGKDVIVTQPNRYGSVISQIDIGVDTNGKVNAISTKTVKMDSTIAPDKTIEALAQPYQDATLKYVKTKIGTSSGEFIGSEQTMKDTALMDLVNRVQLEGAKAQLSIAAPLSLKAYIPKGDITVQDIMSVYVYENFLFGVKMTGKQIKDWMEYSVRYYKQVSNPTDAIAKDPVLNIADYNLDQLYGATYDIDLTQPACTVDSSTGRVMSGNRIKNLKVNGKPVKDTDVFVVAINNYRYNGGGGFMKAAGISNTDPKIVVFDSGKTLGDDGQVRTMMINYIIKNKIITPKADDNWKLYTSPVSQGAPVKKAA